MYLSLSILSTLLYSCSVLQSSLLKKKKKTGGEVQIDLCIHCSLAVQTKFLASTGYGFFVQ